MRVIQTEVATGVITAKQQSLIETWLFRYELREPLEFWQQCSAERKGEMAIRAIVSDGRLLMRIDGRVASQVTKSAEEGLVALTRGPLDDTQHAILILVRARIKAWREMSLAMRIHPQKDAFSLKEKELESARVGPSGLLIPEKYRPYWRDAFVDYPQFNEKVGATVAKVVLHVGPDALRKAESPMDDVFTNVSARFAARSARSVYKQHAIKKEESSRIIQTVQEFCHDTRRVPLMVSYKGREGTYAQRAMTLAHDAISCLKLAEKLPDGPGGKGFEVWEDALESHAYTALMLNPGMLRGMDYDKALVFANSAARHAKQCMERGSGFNMDIPMDEATSSERVYYTAMSSLPNGIQPRMSELANDQRLDFTPDLAMAY